MAPRRLPDVKLHFFQSVADYQGRRGELRGVERRAGRSAGGPRASAPWEGQARSPGPSWVALSIFFKVFFSFQSMAAVPGAGGPCGRGTPPLKARRGVLKGGCTGTGGAPGPRRNLCFFLSMAVVPGLCGSPAAAPQSNNARRGVLKCGCSGPNGEPGSPEPVSPEPWWQVSPKKSRSTRVRSVRDARWQCLGVGPGWLDCWLPVWIASAWVLTQPGCLLVSPCGVPGRGPRLARLLVPSLDGQCLGVDPAWLSVSVPVWIASAWVWTQPGSECQSEEIQSSAGKRRE